MSTMPPRSHPDMAWYRVLSHHVSETPAHLIDKGLFTHDHRRCRDDDAGSVAPRARAT